ncbi:hypothetical protein MBM_09725 [Drepanopeziza brunnea f. sp. 'multigermtubi' MB_m1]|uniref:non-specific serine/threonine protein kinase n=1 Tax=Marssonina brunnea f. sp. multigermtubi (strain MB_m1) TaxID=1072389 RepID=K1WU33_MARBU|nr:uncharacterized protein MBM_09725 [Drepanopeziza brunnea f. sp. 'multigermtubi' MB_m1]EKD12088.1 hypothetical protein MBM_09725 [Drepanopeziza brunnea f. sp. 'multigermtubi' MB_m1]
MAAAGAPGPATAAPADIAAEFNFWNRINYSAFPAMPVGMVMPLYRQQAFGPGTLGPFPPPDPPTWVPRVPGPRVRIDRSYINNVTRQQRFGRGAMARGFGDMSQWRAIRILGTGAFGEVTHWKWTQVGKTSPRSRALSTRQGVRDVAVKTAANLASADFLLNEFNMMTELTLQNDDCHVLKCYNGLPYTLADCQREGIVAGVPGVPAGPGVAAVPPTGWLSRTRKIILEYCKEGSLGDLLERRQIRLVICSQRTPEPPSSWELIWIWISDICHVLDRSFPLTEMTMWHIFRCLADGLSMLEYGAEITTAPNLPPTVPPTFAAAAPAVTLAPATHLIVHLDLKPDNVLMADRDQPTHPDLPVFKIADFGNAIKFSRNPAQVFPLNDFVKDRGRRRRGTQGYYAPEQFTLRWNYNNFMTSPVCGRYGSCTNISRQPPTNLLPSPSPDTGQAAATMYEVGLCADPNRPVATTGVRADQPYQLPPGRTIKGAPALGVLFGFEIDAMTYYSAFFRETLMECLYEVPAHRPTLLQLRATIEDGIARCALAGGAQALEDDWSDIQDPIR